MSDGFKPLGRKAYGSIGHIAGSRMGPADHMVHEGQTLICTTKAPKDKRVYVQTKLDGSCVSAALVNGEIVALGRAGFLAETSPFEQHHMWARWVKAREDRFYAVLLPGERIVGEWLAQAHGTRYALLDVDPFVVFDIMLGDKRLTVAELTQRVWAHFWQPDCIGGPMSPQEAMAQLDTYGADEPEGVVYRVETDRKGVEFLAKWVRPDKQDGKYLPEISGSEPLWNWRES